MLQLEAEQSRLKMTMDAELEKIHAVARSGLSGNLVFVQDHIERSRGEVRFDLMQLNLLHATARGETGQLGEMRVSRKQNDDMRTWLEIGSDAPPRAQSRFRYATFELTRVIESRPPSIPSAPGRYTLELSAEGTFSLHGVEVKKTVALSALVERDEEGVSRLTVETRRPLVLSLEEHDVRPRTAFGVLADRTLEAMGKRVAKEPQVSLDLSFSRPQSNRGER